MAIASKIRGRRPRGNRGGDTKTGRRSLKPAEQKTAATRPTPATAPKQSPGVSLAAEQFAAENPGATQLPGGAALPATPDAIGQASTAQTAAVQVAAGAIGDSLAGADVPGGETGKPGDNQSFLEGVVGALQTAGAGAADVLGSIGDRMIDPVTGAPNPYTLLIPQYFNRRKEIADDQDRARNAAAFNLKQKQMEGLGLRAEAAIASGDVSQEAAAQVNMRQELQAIGMTEAQADNWLAEKGLTDADREERSDLRRQQELAVPPGQRKFLAGIASKDKRDSVLGEIAKQQSLTAEHKARKKGTKKAQARRRKEETIKAVGLQMYKDLTEFVDENFQPRAPTKKEATDAIGQAFPGKDRISRSIRRAYGVEPGQKAPQEYFHDNKKIKDRMGQLMEGGMGWDLAYDGARLETMDARSAFRIPPVDESNFNRGDVEKNLENVMVKLVQMAESGKIKDADQYVKKDLFFKTMREILRDAGITNQEQQQAIIDAARPKAIARTSR
jgi:hypothetical protein